jgi:adenosylhomocysteinase
MDMSFTNQALACEYIAKNHERFERKVYKVPDEIDRKIAELKLKSMGVKIDSLTTEQRAYLESWELGT